MRIHYTLLILCFSVAFGYSQNKIKAARTFNDMCFLTIDQDKLDQFLEVQQSIAKRDFTVAYPIIKQMKKSLRKFDLAAYARTFEFWYIANYIDFEKQVAVAQASTLNALKEYDKRLHKDQALYFDHHMFLMHYLAYLTEAFYPDFWFMSMERFFSKDAVARIKRDNPELGKKLFDFSEVYQPFAQFDAMVKHERKSMAGYLGIEIDPDKDPLIPYSYGFIDSEQAAMLLEQLKLDDATQELNLDREIRAFKRFLKQARAKKIWLVARFDTIPFRSLNRE